MHCKKVGKQSSQEQDDPPQSVCKNTAQNDKDRTKLIHFDLA